MACEMLLPSCSAGTAAENNRVVHDVVAATGSGDVIGGMAKDGMEAQD